MKGLFDKELIREMHKNNIFQKDITESFIKSSGPGGQNVNKVATCVLLVHAPTNIKIKCQIYRTQNQNRIEARKLLLNKIIKTKKEESLLKKAILIKKKRQNRKRTKSSKEEMLKNKKKRSEKKVTRNKISAQKLKDYI